MQGVPFPGKLIGVAFVRGDMYRKHAQKGQGSISVLFYGICSVGTLSLYPCRRADGWVGGWRVFLFLDNNSVGAAVGGSIARCLASVENCRR